MEHYHYYFFLLKFLIIMSIALMALKIIPMHNKLFILIDTVYKISLGLFIIIFFARTKLPLDKHDRILIILSGLVLLLLIDYIAVINVLFNKHYKDERCP